MTEAKDIDAIDDISEMFQIMAFLGVSSKGLKTLDEMKTRVKETLETSKKKESSWTAKEVRLCCAVPSSLSSVSQNQSSFASDFLVSCTTSLVYEIAVHYFLTDNVLKQIQCI